MARTGIALGSNLGERAENLRAALDGLRGLASPGSLVMVAPLYETEPLGCPKGSPAFLNTVVEIDWPGMPLELLAKTRALEICLGRIPNPVRNAPRVIDIDILYCGDAAVDSPDLELPHPRMVQRRFVLMPLADIRPAFKVMPSGIAVRDLLASLDSDEPLPVRVESSCWKTCQCAVSSTID